MVYDILTIGGIMRDIIFLTDEGLVINNPQNPLCQKLIGFELGAKVYVDKVYFEAGGGASNTAAGFSKLGLKTAILGRVGEDREGMELIKGLKKQKIDTRLIQIDKKTSTGLSYILGLKSIKRAQAIFTYTGSNANLVLKIRESDLKSAKWIYISSLNSPTWEKFLNKVFSLKKTGIKIIWNPSNVQLKAGWKKIGKYLKKTEILILNDDEARELVLSKVKTKNLNNKYLLKRIYEMGPKIVVITAGKNGAYAYNGKIYYQKAAPAKVINITGAGDSFAAGFVSSLIYNPNDIQRALKWGAVDSASVINQIGAQRGLLNKNQITILSKKISP